MLYRIITRAISFWRRPASSTPSRSAPRTAPAIVVPQRTAAPQGKAVVQRGNIPQRQVVPALQGAVFRGKCYVVDGDTLRIGRTQIRLAGIDAPEIDQPWGQKAKWELFAMCKGQIVTARATGETSWGRVIATCFLADGTDLGAEMVRLGHALDFTPFSGGRYKKLEPSDVRRKFRGLHQGQVRMMQLGISVSSPSEHPL